MNKYTFNIIALFGLTCNGECMYFRDFETSHVSMKEKVIQGIKIGILSTCDFLETFSATTFYIC